MEEALKMCDESFRSALVLPSAVGGSSTTVQKASYSSSSGGLKLPAMAKLGAGTSMASPVKGAAAEEACKKRRKRMASGESQDDSSLGAQPLLGGVEDVDNKEVLSLVRVFEKNRVQKNVKTAKKNMKAKRDSIAAGTARDANKEAKAASKRLAELNREEDKQLHRCVGKLKQLKEPLKRLREEKISGEKKCRTAIYEQLDLLDGVTAILDALEVKYGEQAKEAAAFIREQLKSKVAEVQEVALEIENEQQSHKNVAAVLSRAGFA